MVLHDLEMGRASKNSGVRRKRAFGPHRTQVTGASCATTEEKDTVESTVLFFFSLSRLARLRRQSVCELSLGGLGSVTPYQIRHVRHRPLRTTYEVQSIVWWMGPTRNHSTSAACLAEVCSQKQGPKLLGDFSFIPKGPWSSASSFFWC